MQRLRGSKYKISNCFVPSFTAFARREISCCKLSVQYCIVTISIGSFTFTLGFQPHSSPFHPSVVLMVFHQALTHPSRICHLHPMSRILASPSIVVRVSRPSSHLHPRGSISPFRHFASLPGPVQGNLGNQPRGRS